MPINYTPKPEFPPWTDQISVVRASGEDGFNARFHAVFAEFVAISRHLGAIGEALDRLDAPVQVQPETLTLTPATVAFTDSPWEQGNGVIKSPKDSSIAAGFMPLTLPHGAVFTKFRSYGVADGNSSATARLERQLLVGEAPREQIAVLTGTGGAFTENVALSATPITTVDVTQFKYRLYLQWNAGGPSQTGMFSSVQITYQPKP